MRLRVERIKMEQSAGGLKLVHDKQHSGHCVWQTKHTWFSNNAYIVWQIPIRLEAFP